MKTHRILLSFALFVLLAQSAFAGINPWFGTWKLNREKSITTGDTYTIARVGDKYRMDFGAVKFDLEDDGRDYPTMPPRTIS